MTRGRRKGEDERGVENLAHTYCRVLKNRGFSLSVPFYIILPATLAGVTYAGCHEASYARTRGVTRGRRKGEDGLGVENSA